METWNKNKAMMFVTAVCAFHWAIYAALSFGSNGTVSIPDLGVSFNTGPMLVVYAALVPAVCCLLFYRESRASVSKLRASISVYAVAAVLGLIPLVKYLVPGNPNFAWELRTATRFISAFIDKLFLITPWVGIIWQGCFLRKIRTFTSAGSGILLMSAAFILWQGGPILLSYRQGTATNILFLLPLFYFFVGIMLGSLFELSEGSVWPCVLLATLYDASTHDYYSIPGPVVNRFALTAELLLVVAIAAAVLYWVATRRRNSLGAFAVDTYHSQP
jgi:hypothetical protein